MKQRPATTIKDRHRIILMNAMLWIAVAMIGCGSPAQLGSNDESLKEVDALYTAVSTRSVKLLDASAARLEVLHTQGKLTDAAHRQLKPLIDTAREGKWGNSQRQLYEFMRGQRRS